MSAIAKAIEASPVLAILGFALLVALIVLPLALALAGLTGSQILTLFKASFDFVLQLIRDLRKPPDAD